MGPILHLLVLVATLAPTAYAVTFQRSYVWPGDDAAIGVVAATDGGFLVLGRAESIPAFGALRLIRLDSNGDTIWTRVVDVPGVQFQAAAMAPDTDGGALTVGRCRRERVDWDYCVVAVDRSGGLRYWNAWGGASNEGLRAVLRTPRGWVVCGTTLENGEYDVRLTWLDDSGRVSGGVTLVEAGPQQVGGLAGDWDGSYVIAVNQPTGGSQYSWISLTKVDSLGRTAWSRRYGDTLWDEARSVVGLGQTGSATVGFSATLDMGMQGAVFRSDSSGQVVWVRQYGFAGSDRLYGGTATADGGLALVGESHPPSGGTSDVYFASVDAGGALLWERLIGGALDDYAGCVVQLADGGFVLAGGSGATGSLDCCVIRTDASGIVGLPGKAASWGSARTPQHTLFISGAVRLPDGTGSISVTGSTGRVIDVVSPGDVWPAAGRVAAGVYIARYADGSTLRLIKPR